MGADRASKWRPQLESNQHLSLRRASFYPLNYGDYFPATAISSARILARLNSIAKPKDALRVTKLLKYRAFWRHLRINYESIDLLCWLNCSTALLREALEKISFQTLPPFCCQSIAARIAASNSVLTWSATRFCCK